MDRKRVDDELDVLSARVGCHHLNLRLGIEQDYEARVFGQGLNFFHLENWYSIHGFIRGALRLVGVHGRGKRNARRIHCIENPVPIANLPAAFEGYRILHLTDLHLDMAEDMPHVLSEAVRQVDYDLCLMTGDYRARTYGDIDAALAGMQQLMVHLQGPVYAVLGNHDSLRMVPAMENMGIRLLLNENAAVERGGERLFLAGIDDAHYYRADNLEKALTGVPLEAVSILLSHSPEIFKQAAHMGCDFMLSGHTHGGQICMPGGRPLMCNARCPRDLCAGPWRHHRLQGYTSRGSGVSVVDVRLNCPAEITVHRLHGA